MKKISNILFLLLFLSPIVFAQKLQTFNLFDLQNQGKLTVVNRIAVAANQDGEKYVKLSEKDNEGILWLPIESFENGTIEIETRGKDVLQRSFIGLIFHGQNDSIYDAVYCRPFNFFAEDSVRKINAIQYISHPNYTWKKLRETRNSEFEEAIQSPPNPNGWFTLKLLIKDKTVKAFINQSKEPSLSIKKLSDTKGGKLGIFVGDGSGGDFKTVKIWRK